MNKLFDSQRRSVRLGRSTGVAIRLKGGTALAMHVEFAAFAYDINHLLTLECKVQQPTLFVSLIDRTNRWPHRFGSDIWRHARNNIMPLVNLQKVPSIAKPV